MIAGNPIEPFTDVSGLSRLAMSCFQSSRERACSVAGLSRVLKRPVSSGEPRVAPVQAHSERIEQRTGVQGARDFPGSALIWKAPRLLWRARRCCGRGGRDRSARTKQGNGWRWRNHLRHWRRVHPNTGNGGRREDSRNDRDDNTGSGRWRSDVDADRSRCRGHQRAQSTGRRSDDGW